MEIRITVRVDKVDEEDMLAGVAMALHRARQLATHWAGEQVDHDDTERDVYIGTRLAAIYSVANEPLEG